MKQLFALFVAVAFSGAQVFAETVEFPNDGDPLFKITIPDTWEPDQDEDDVLEASSPKEHIQLSVWELDDKEDADDLEDDVTEFLSDHAKKIKFDAKPQEAHPGGLDGKLYQGRAVDKEDGSEIEFYALLITTKTRAAVVFIEVDATTPKKEAQQLFTILKSITPPDGEKVLQASLAVDENSRPTTRFAADVEKIHLLFAGEDLAKGDEIKAVWYAEDVGEAAPKNSRIDAAALKATSETDKGTFTLSRPTNGWPAGSYRVDILVNDKRVESLKFRIASES